jgi:23S rRNA pseudouridine1911/1915/1917 synthase
MLLNLRFQVPPHEAGTRADRFLLKHIGSTDRALVRRAFEEHSVSINGRPASKGAVVQPNDMVEVARLYETADRRVAPAPNAPLNVVHEDETVLVFDKPAGIPVHPLRIGELGTLANAMVARYPETANIGPHPLFPALVHRIDTDTSGLVLAARTPAAYEFLRRQFATHSIAKEYLAVVCGAPPPSGELVHYLAHDPKRPGRMLAALTPQKNDRRRWMKAVTEYRLERTGRNLSLLRIVIRTGVTHQIRCQMAAIGYPVFGDATYGGQDDRTRHGANRHFLHATAIAFVHPASGQRVRFESPPPANWEALFH